MNLTTMLLLAALAAAPAGRTAAAEPAADSQPPASSATDNRQPTTDNQQKARITVQVVSARAGSDADDGRIDPRLAAKLRVTLAQLGIRKPDLAAVGGGEQVAGVGETVTVRAANYCAEVTCKSAEAGKVVVKVELFAEGKGGRRLQGSYTAELKGDQVAPFAQPAGEGKFVIFVVAAAPATARP